VNVSLHYNQGLGRIQSPAPETQAKKQFTTTAPEAGSIKAIKGDRHQI
jgi:hypothetical protein